jgi:hypothetical protein
MPLIYQGCEFVEHWFCFGLSVAIRSGTIRTEDRFAIRPPRKAVEAEREEGLRDSRAAAVVVFALLDHIAFDPAST